LRRKGKQSIPCGFNQHPEQSGFAVLSPPAKERERMNNLPLKSTAGAAPWLALPRGILHIVVIDH
jgi:hypothetical protein